jgi:hypothetical protein
VDVNEGKHAEVWTESVYEEQVSLLFFRRDQGNILLDKKTHINSKSPSSSIAASSLLSTPESLGKATRPDRATSKIP